MLQAINQINISKLVKNTLLITSIFLIGLSTTTSSINSNARQQEQFNQELFSNPQSILNISFKDNVYLDNIIDNELNPDKNWQGLTFDKTKFGITGLSGLSNIGGVEELVSINGQFNQRSIKREYNSKLKELITKIDDIKNNNQPTDNEIVKKELSKMNGIEVKRQRYWDWSQAKILQLSLVGNNETLSTLKNILEKSGHIKSIVFNDINKIYYDFLNINDKTIDDANKEILSKINEMKNNAGIKDDIQDSINKEFENAPHYYKNPVSREILNEENIESYPKDIISSLMHGIAAKAEGKWDRNLKTVWCGWSPCGMKLFLGSVHQNALAFTIGAGGTYLAAAKGATWVYNMFNKLTYLCGPAIIQCNVALFAASFAIIMYLQTMGFSYEKICEYAKWASGVEYEISFKGGIRIAKCSNGI